MDGELHLAIAFVGEAEIHELNRDHRDRDKPTDVLSFPIDGLDAAGSGDPDGPGLVGDVVVCPSVAMAAAPSHAGRPDDEIALLVVHGALHLLGHDHAEADERAVMRGRERALLADLHGPLAGDPWSDDEGSEAARDASGEWSEPGEDGR